MDLAIAATANIHNVRLLTENTGDFAILADLVDSEASGWRPQDEIAGGPAPD